MFFWKWKRSNFCSSSSATRWLGQFRCVSSCLSSRDWKGFVVHEFQVPPIPWSLFRSRKPEAKPRVSGTEESSGWCFWKASQVFLKCGRGCISRWFSSIHSGRPLTHWLCLFVSCGFQFDSLKVWGVFFPPNVFTKNDRSWKKKHAQFIFEESRRNSKNLSLLFSVSFGWGPPRHSAATRIFWSLQPLKPSKDTSQLCRWWKNHRDPIRLRRNFLKSRKWQPQIFSVFG